MKEWYDIVATNDKTSEHVTDCTFEQFQEEQRTLFAKGFKVMQVYRFTEKNGFDKRVNYVRGKNGWKKIA